MVVAMKQLIAISTLAFIGCVTSPLETSSTEQHQEVIIIEEQLPNCDALGGNYEPVSVDGRWVCQCFAFCTDPSGPRDPGGPGGGGGVGGGGGGRGDGESKDDSNDDPSACLSKCQTERNEDMHECIDLAAYDLCHYGFSNPDGTSLPAVCKIIPNLLSCEIAFEECERRWKYDFNPNAVTHRQWCATWATNGMRGCTTGCFEGSEGTTCDASIGGTTTIDDGTLDSEGTCWGEDGANTDCASPDQVSCQYGSDASD